jgi:hypothetical protein
MFRAPGPITVFASHNALIPRLLYGASVPSDTKMHLHKRPVKRASQLTPRPPLGSAKDKQCIRRHQRVKVMYSSCFSVLPVEMSGQIPWFGVGVWKQRAAQYELSALSHPTSKTIANMVAISFPFRKHGKGDWNEKYHKNMDDMEMRHRDSLVSIATGYGLDFPGSILRRIRFFFSPQRQVWLWGPPSFLSSGYRRRFRRIKPASRWILSPTSGETFAPPYVFMAWCLIS